MIRIMNIDNKEGLKMEWDDLRYYMKEAIQNLDVECDLQWEEDNSLRFGEIKEGEHFRSKVDNYVMLKDKDKRIKKLGRNYLRSTKPTKPQFTGTLNIICDIFDDLDWKANIIYEHKDSSYTLRTVDNGTNREAIKTLASSKRFPKTDKETKDVRKDSEAA